MSTIEAKNLPLVSVIVPTCNSEKTIEICLSSIKAQSYTNIEILVIDNHSKDKTREIATKYCAQVYLKGGERAAQVNYGVKMARGKFIFFTGADMLVEKDYIKEAVEKCLKEGYDAIYASVLTKGEKFWQKVKGLERTMYIGDNSIESARFFRRDVFLNIGGYDESLLFGGDDYDFQRRLNLSGYRTGRIKSVEWHLDEPDSLSKVFIKTLYYAITVRNYVKKHKGYALKQLMPIRLSFLRNYKLLLKNPLLFIGFLVFKYVQYTAAIMGTILSLLHIVGLSELHDNIYTSQAKFKT
ncbi:MAG: glycosyltransferase family 2 protein [Candidatus Brockarchaeota archaeon]|nr:glycosyltransferase family 2 protein [Candidatus Brockarchaeota archaeon]